MSRPIKRTEAASSWLQVRVTPADKAAWVKAASRKGLNLSEYVINTLNDAPQAEAILEGYASTMQKGQR